MTSELIDVTNIDLNLLTFDNNYISYDGKRFYLKTDYMNLYYNSGYDKFNIRCSEELKAVLEHIDGLISHRIPPKTKHSKLFRSDGKDNAFANIGVKYAAIYDENKQPTNVETLKTQRRQIRCILSFGKFYTMNKYAGIKLNLVQGQISPPVIPQNHYSIFLFN